MDVKTDGSGEYYMMPVGQYFEVTQQAVTELDGTQPPSSLTRYFGSVELVSLSITAQAAAVSEQFLIISSEKPVTEQDVKSLAPSFNSRSVETKNFDLTLAYAFTTDFLSQTTTTKYLIFVDFIYKCRDPKITPGFRNNNINLNFQSKYVKETCSKKNKFTLDDEEHNLKVKLKKVLDKKKEYGL
jgi:hypothetical protein